MAIFSQFVVAACTAVKVASFVGKIFVLQCSTTKTTNFAPPPRKLPARRMLYIQVLNTLRLTYAIKRSSNVCLSLYNRCMVLSKAIPCVISQISNFSSHTCSTVLIPMSRSPLLLHEGVQCYPQPRLHASG